jgi:hypothetical protein
MHPRAHIAQALALAEHGRNASEIAQITGYPRSTVRGWIARSTPRASAGEQCPRCGGAGHDIEHAGGEYVYLLGLYLGDGCISAHPRGVFKLRITLDARHPQIIEECRRAIAAVLPKNTVGARPRSGGFENSAPESNLEIYAYSKTWPCLIPQHGPGRKHTRAIELAPWQVALVDAHPEQLLRGLIHSDGCRFINTGRNWRHPRYSFSNRSADIRRIFCDACDRVGLRWTEAPHTVYVSRTADVARLDEFVGPKA